MRPNSPRLARYGLLFLALAALAGAARADCLRIVSQSPYITRALDWLGLGPRIVGVSRYDEPDIGRAASLTDIDACGGVPYSYGRHTTPYDLLSQSGYKVVESHETLRHLRACEPYETIAQLVAATHPEAVVALINTRSPSCNAQLAEVRVPVIAINDDKFVHPGPGLIEALEQLGEASHE